MLLISKWNLLVPFYHPLPLPFHSISWSLLGSHDGSHVSQVHSLSWQFRLDRPIPRREQLKETVTVCNIFIFIKHFYFYVSFFRLKTDSVWTPKKVKEKSINWRDTKLGKRFSVRSFNTSSWLMFTLVNIHLISRTLYILKIWLLLSTECSLNYSLIAYNACTVPSATPPAEPRKSNFTILFIAKQNISPT